MIENMDAIKKMEREHYDRVFWNLEQNIDWSLATI